MLPPLLVAIVLLVIEGGLRLTGLGDVRPSPVALLRRALDVVNERVENVASRHEMACLDTVELLTSAAAHGIIGFDVEAIHDRNLWKYDQLLAQLDEMLKEDPENVRALVYRGDARSFRVDGAADTLRDWREALALDPTLDEVRGNLERLEATRPPAR